MKSMMAFVVLFSSLMMNGAFASTFRSAMDDRFVPASRSQMPNAMILAQSHARQMPPNVHSYRQSRFGDTSRSRSRGMGYRHLTITSGYPRARAIP